MDIGSLLISLCVCNHVAVSLEERVFEPSTWALTSQRAAFELSICDSFGFGVNKDDAETSAFLKQVKCSQEELIDEIDRLRHGKLRLSSRQGISGLSLYRGHIELATGAIFYQEQGVLDGATWRIRKGIADVESVLGDGHRIIAILKLTLSKTYILQER